MKATMTALAIGSHAINMYRHDLFLVFRSKGESYNVLLADFLAIKNNEVQTAIGKCWQNGRSIMNADKKHKEDTKLDEYLKVIAKYPYRTG